MEEKIKEIMTVPWISVEERLKIVGKIKSGELKEKDVDEILSTLHNFDDGADKMTNKYYSKMDKVYKQYLDKNIPIIKQGIQKANLSIQEEISNEKEGNPDSLLNQL